MNLLTILIPGLPECLITNTIMAAKSHRYKCNRVFAIHFAHGDRLTSDLDMTLAILSPSFDAGRRKRTEHVTTS